MIVLGLGYKSHLILLNHQSFYVQFNREKTKTTKSATLHNSTEAITVKQAVGGDGGASDDDGNGVITIVGKGRATMTARDKYYKTNFAVTHFDSLFKGLS